MLDGVRRIREIEKCDKEGDLIELAEEIGDKIIFRGYSQEQVICIVKELVKINLLSVKYETREEILSVLCDATANYNIKDQIEWRNILSIKGKLEDDLKEYIEEFIG